MNDVLDKEQGFGITACGYFVLDRIREIDAWPQEEGMAEVLDESAHNGGGPSNVLAGLARMGAEFPLRAIGRVGDDEFGRQIIANCSQDGVDTDSLTALPGVPTSACDVMSCRKTGRRTFLFRRGASAQLNVEYITAKIDNSRIFYLGYPLLLDQMDRVKDGLSGHTHALRCAKEAGQITAVDLVSIDGPLLRVLQSALPYIDHLFLNDQECTRLTGIHVRKSDQPQPSEIIRALKKLHELGLNGWAVLHMPEGCWAWNPEHGLQKQGRLKLPKEQIKGANGAGDALAAGYLYAIHEGHDTPTALLWGVCAAAACLCACSASDGIHSLEHCLEMGRRYGFLNGPEAD